MRGKKQHHAATTGRLNASLLMVADLLTAVNNVRRTLLMVVDGNAPRQQSQCADSVVCWLFPLISAWCQRRVCC
jgi:hypothetical protein